MEELKEELKQEIIRQYKICLDAKYSCKPQQGMPYDFYNGQCDAYFQILMKGFNYNIEQLYAIIEEVKKNTHRYT